MMYGFGYDSLPSQIHQDMQTTHAHAMLCRDVSNPLPESIDLLEDMVVEYVVEMVTSPCPSFLHQQQ